MSNRVEQQLQENALNDKGSDEKTKAILYRIEREIVPLLRALRDLSNSVLTGFGSTVEITADDSPYTMANDVEFVRADATGGNITLFIPAAASTEIRILSVKKTDSSSNVVNVTAVSGEDIDDGPDAPVTIGQTFLRFIPRGGGYDIA